MPAIIVMGGPALQRAQQQHAHARPSTSGCSTHGPCSLSRRDWLSNELEPDPEHLEVNSSQTPQKKQASATAAAGGAAVASDSGGDQHGPKRPASGSSISSSGSDSQDGWPAESAASRRVSGPLLPGLALVQRSPPRALLLPAPASEAPATPEADAIEAAHASQPAGAQLQLTHRLARQHEQPGFALPHAEQALPRSLFDLASLDMELHDLLG